MLAGGTARADEHGTGVESMGTDVLEANFRPGQGNSPTLVWIRGGGFVPETEVSLFIADSNGVLTDISVTADPPSDGGGSVYPLIANEQGAWATRWKIGRFTRAGAGGEGVFTIWAMDKDYNVLATTSLALCNTANRAEGEAIPPFCSK
jgi:hypothetical protein